jgi:hypothetical protein
LEFALNDVVPAWLNNINIPQGAKAAQMIEAGSLKFSVVSIFAVESRFGNLNDERFFVFLMGREPLL